MYGGSSFVSGGLASGPRAVETSADCIQEADCVRRVHLHVVAERQNPPYLLFWEFSPWRLVYSQ